MNAEKEILGYEFRNPRLLERALTMPSCRIDDRNTKDNQRLEFLGDAVLGLLSAERVYDEFPDEQEGPLTVRRAHLVSAPALCDAANRLSLVKRLKRNRHAEELPKYAKGIADAVEAIIGAAYLDGGFAAARQVFESLELSAHAEEAEWSVNAKGELQMLSQAMTPQRHPEYELVKVEGKAHEPQFTVRVTVDGVGSAVATAGSRRRAEALAASSLLKIAHQSRADGN